MIIIIILILNMQMGPYKHSSMYYLIHFPKTLSSVSGAVLFTRILQVRKQRLEVSLLLSLKSGIELLAILDIVFNHKT